MRNLLSTSLISRKNRFSRYRCEFSGNPFTMDPNDKKDTYFRLLFGVGYNENEKINLEFNISGKQKLTNTV